jgi:hypothetical protein
MELTRKQFWKQSSVPIKEKNPVALRKQQKKHFWKKKMKQKWKPNQKKYWKKTLALPRKKKKKQFK